MPRAGRKKGWLNCRGMTLIEVLVSLVILSTATVFVLGALVKAAEVQRVQECRSKAQFFALSKFAALEMRVLPPQKIDEKQKGRFQDGKDAFEWDVQNSVEAGETQDENGEALQTPLILKRELHVSWNQGEEKNSMSFQTLSWYRPPAE
ncbi:MAG TPA: type II secretion system protein [Verrucomicrobiae bacterium]|jgi:prepilin-type N-terminal cleavage/methylation domain-containing protein|nr:type II secretion system protein [Verrucomicrobiae bacterium]